MASPPLKKDRRWQRTRNALHEALMELIEEERDYDQIHVREICERADVARPTFYLHFKDKHELLWSSMEVEFESLRTRMRPIHGDTLLPDDGRPLTFIVFEHVAANRGFYRAMLGKHGSAGFILRYLEHMADAFYQKHAPLRERLGDPEFAPELIPNHLAGSLVGMIQWWLKQDRPPSADEMARAFTCLNAPGVLSAMGLRDVSDLLENV
ncbi:MAG: TetR/AcrR family transcriptional regulator [bacterium]|nr:TetR/AcrR family transcriptional regulator [bacterium]